MVKPSWVYAPEWAQWIAQDPDGSWYWFEEMPYQNALNFWHVKSGKVYIAVNPTSENILEARPCQQK